MLENTCRQIAAALDSILAKNEVPETERDNWPEPLRDIFGRVHEAFTSIGSDQRETEEKTQEAIRAACASLETGMDYCLYLPFRVPGMATLLNRSVTLCGKGRT